MLKTSPIHVRKCPLVTQYFSHKNSYSLKATIKTQYEQYSWHVHLAYVKILAFSNQLQML